MTYFKRPLVPLFVAYLFGLWLGRAVEFAPFLAFGILLAALAWSGLRREATPVILAVTMDLGLVFSFLSARDESNVRTQIEKLSPPISVVLTGRVSGAVFADELPQRFVVANPVVKTEAGDLALKGHVLVTLVARGESLTTRTPLCGEQVQLFGALDLPQSYRNFYGFDRREQLARRGIYAVLRASHYETIAPAGLPGYIFARLVELRRYATEVLKTAVSPDESRWLASMLFNDRRVLQAHEVRWLRDSNMFHLFAVSGLHVGALAAVFLVILRALSLSWPRAWFIASVMIWGYVALTGFVPSAVRAAAMLSAYAATVCLRREIDPLSAIVAGCFGVLLVQPTLFWEPGFLLSVAGVLGIVTFFPLLQRIFSTGNEPNAKLIVQTTMKLVGDAALVTLAVMLAVLPLQLYFFNQINLCSPLANVFAALLAGPIVASGIATILLSLISSQMAVLCGAASGFLMQLLMGLIEFTAHQSWAIVHVPHLPLAAVFGYYLALVSGYYFVSRDTPEFLPKARARLALHTLAGVAMIVIALAWQRTDRRFHLWFFDVGQGDSALLRLPTGHTLLVDTGNNLPDMGRLVVVPQLRALGCWPLDYLVITHEDSDHSGSAPSIIEEWNVKTLVVSHDVVNGERFFPEKPPAEGLPHIERVCAGRRVLIAPELELEVLNPDCTTSPSLTSDNDRSVVLRIRYKNFSVLMTGDVEQAGELFMLSNNLPRCDVLKVAHHGSHSSSTDLFLQAVRPQIAVISCGRRNRYGHPSPAVLERLEKHGASVYRTDYDGAIWVATDGDRIEVRTAARQRM